MRSATTSPPASRPTACTVERRPWLRWPRNAAQALDQLGVTVGGLYQCDEASGDLRESDGGTSLTATSGPAYLAHAGPRRGVGYPAYGSKHAANTASVGLSSAVFAVAVSPHAAAAGTLPGYMVRSDTIGQYTFGIYGQGAASGLGWTVIARSAGAYVAVGELTTMAGGDWLIVGQIDRAASVLRGLLVTSAGRVVDTSASVAAIGTVEGGTMNLFLGGGGICTGGMAVGGALWFTGAQAEGADLPRLLARRLGAL